MKPVKILLFLLLTACFSGSFQLLAAPKTLDEIESEQQENEKKAVAENCMNNSAADCVTYAQRFAENDKEKLTYYTIACDLQYQPACDEVKKAKKAAEAEKARIAAEKKRKAEAEKRKIKAEKARKAAEEKRKAEAEERRIKAEKARKAAEEKRKAEAEKERQRKEREAQMKKELNKAGRKKRIAIATGVLVPGVALIGVSAFSFYMMSDAQKWHDKYYQKYLAATDSSTADKYHKKTKKAGDHAQLYKILGSVGIGVGAAMVVTGIVFYSIEFEGEKQVKKKYNVSFGASPMDGTLQFALRW